MPAITYRVTLTDEEVDILEAEVPPNIRLPRMR
jgi:hypothetical protein